MHGLSQPGRGLVHFDQLFATRPRPGEIELRSRQAIERGFFFLCAVCLRIKFVEANQVATKPLPTLIPID